LINKVFKEDAMSDYHGKFVWYELMTSNIKAAADFYSGALGWTAKDSGMPGMDYTIFNAGEAGVAGAMTLPQILVDMKAPPHWIGYIAVDDVDVYAKKIADAGGVIHKAPDDIPGVGRFAVAADPHGASFSIFKPAEGAQAPEVPPNAVGHVGWRELCAGDLDTAFAFYSGLFGWTKGEAFNMGPMGAYQLFAWHGTPIGGMMTKPPFFPQPVWGYYFNVDAIDKAVDRAMAGRGQVINGPMQVPGGDWVAQCLDPQGARFAMTSRQK
jgi:predicted enzyme related to lactoylglutathione lyase